MTWPLFAPSSTYYAATSAPVYWQLFPQLQITTDSDDTDVQVFPGDTYRTTTKHLESLNEFSKWPELRI